MKGAKQHILYLLLTLIYLCGVSGCVDEQHPVDCAAAEEVEVLLRVRFNLSTNSTRATDSGTTWERSVRTLRILVFNDDESLDTMLYIDDPSGEPIEINTIVKAGDKTFVMLGNEPAYLSGDLEDVEELLELRAMQLTTHPDQYSPGLPFVTMEKVTVVREQEEAVELTLKRAVAKTEMKLVKADDNYCMVELVKIEIVDTPDKSALLPGNPLPAIGMLTTVTDNIPSLVIEKTEITQGTHYLYEHLTGTGDAEANRATRIRLELMIDGVLNTYLIPLVTQNESQAVVNDVIRNTLYRMNILIHPYSIFVDYSIYAWDWDNDDDNTYDKELGGDKDSFYSIGLWIEANTWQVELPTAD